MREKDGGGLFEDSGHKRKRRNRTKTTWETFPLAKSISNFQGIYGIKFIKEVTVENFLPFP